MNGIAKQMIRIAVTGILFLLLFTGCACAEGKPLKASCPSRCGEAVTSREGKDGLILSLPGFWDLSAIRLEMDGAEALLFGDERTEIRTGEDADLTGLAGRRLRLRNQKGRELGYVTILQGSEIPSLFLEVDGNELKKVNRSKNNVITEGRALYFEADGTVSYDGTLEQLKGRGNNTFRYSKKPYQLKLEKKTSLSGMGKGKTWILLANWCDISLLRNQIVLDMSEAIGLRNSVRCVQADLWINGSYNGLYLLAEKIQIGKGRINITDLEEETEKVNDSPFDPGKMSTDKTAYPLMRNYPAVKDPEDITGGYIMTIEKKARLRDYVLAGFRTKDELSIRIKEPTYPSKAQAEYLYGLITEVQKALIAENGIGPESGKPYEDYLDTGSFVRKFLIEDWCKNFDFYGGSQYMYKDSDLVDPLIYAGPSWDYDLCFGNMSMRGHRADGAYLTATKKKSNIYWLLYNHEPFRKEVSEVWKNAFRPAAAVLLGEAEAKPGSALKSIDAYREQIAASAAMNYRRWYVSQEANGKGNGQGFDYAVETLKQWIAGRVEWMDGEYGTEAAK